MAKTIVVVKWRGTNRYAVSIDGNIIDTKTNKPVSTFLRNGYKCVRLNDGAKYRNEYTHRLIGMAFIENPDRLPCINHIDGDKQNNAIDNLEWCTYAQNIWHRYHCLPIERQGRQGRRGWVGPHPGASEKPIKCLETEEVFCSIMECERKTGISHTALCEHLKGRNKTCAGKHWEYI